MTKYYTNNYPLINLYKKTKRTSEVLTQMIYGDSFSIIKKKNKWLKIKIKEDNYSGFIENKNFTHYLKPTHKINKLKVNIYKFPNKIKILNYLTYGSKIKVLKEEKNFLKFEKGWIKKKEAKLISYKEKNLFKQVKIFRNIKYKWGGKSFLGIDCSALVQVLFNFNNRYCPRDTKDQIKYFKKNVQLKNIKKNDMIFWKGHVAIALSNKKLIHAYGPKKKTLIMGIDQTIKRIKKTANLDVIGVKRI
tara:strand:+ start:130 stop:870 length:741 start_codon:yes stop_codon:yes gene_type:complete